ncbi:MAG: DNA topoisomerase IB [Chloroflexi bacterium]|nr:DNA topoisomerase IB [Chloroflexota bacterium]
MAKTKSASTPVVIDDPVAAARAAGLRYVSDTTPGIRRKRAGKSFFYLGVDGKPIRDPAELRRLKSLGIPPAWTDVWICPNPRGHVQATGRDAKGRKQYRYHPRWREVRDETKYGRLLAFGEALPRLRERVEADLNRPGLSRERVLATVVRLLEATRIRIGNEEYARTNDSYGLTTLRNDHVDVAGPNITFSFRGKSAKNHEIGLRDRRLASVVKRCQDLPGQTLFQFRDETGEYQSVDSADVNEYLHQIAGEEFTAKDFRTWAGTVLAARALCELEPGESESQAKKNVADAIKSVAQQLGNTPAICRKCYVHPAVIDAYLDGSTLLALRERLSRPQSSSPTALRPEEDAVLILLRTIADPADSARLAS